MRVILVDCVDCVDCVEGLGVRRLLISHRREGLKLGKSTHDDLNYERILTSYKIVGLVIIGIEMNLDSDLDYRTNLMGNCTVLYRLSFSR